MTKITLIAARCRELLSANELERKLMPTVEVEMAEMRAAHNESGWRSTLAAIEFAAECEEDGYKAHSLTEAIDAAKEAL